MVEALAAMGFSENEIVSIVMDNFACHEGEAKFIIDLELGKAVGCMVALDEGTLSESDPLRL